MMLKYKPFIGALKPMLITLAYANEHIFPKLMATATEIHEKNKHRTFKDVLEKCSMGSMVEHGIKLCCDDYPNIWARFSRQRNTEEHKFDISYILRTDFDLWSDKEVLIDTKTSNRFCKTDFFEFNMWDPYDQSAAGKILRAAQIKRSGSNLNFFIQHAHETELLVTADFEVVEGGWLITPKYVIHRDAFDVFKTEDKRKYVTRWLDNPDKPYYYLRYAQAIRDGLCVKISSQHT